MERSGGEPDVIGRGERSGEYLFVDCSPESPKGRRSSRYDREALEACKKHTPEGNAVERAGAMGALLSLFAPGLGESRSLCRPLPCHGWGAWGPAIT
jgi:hypothetical protein